MAPKLGWCLRSPPLLLQTWQQSPRCLRARTRRRRPGKSRAAVTQSTPEPAEPGRPALPPGGWVLPWSRAGSGVPFPWLGPEAPGGESWQQPGESLPRTASSARAAPGQPQSHPITKACGALWGSVPTLASHQGYLCQHRLTAKVPGAARMLHSQNQEVATKQLPAPTRTSPCWGPRAPDPPAQAQRCQALLLAQPLTEAACSAPPVP